jgi:Flp pilus assembly protein TadD
MTTSCVHAEAIITNPGDLTNTDSVPGLFLRKRFSGLLSRRLKGQKTKDADAWTATAFSLLAIHDFELAAKTATEAVMLAPESPAALFVLGLAQETTGYLTAAEEIIGQAFNLSNANPVIGRELSTLRRLNRASRD